MKEDINCPFQRKCLLMIWNSCSNSRFLILIFNTVNTGGKDSKDEQ